MIAIQDGNIIKNVLSDSVTPGLEHRRELDGLSSGSVVFSRFPGWCDKPQNEWDKKKRS